MGLWVQFPSVVAVFGYRWKNKHPCVWDLATRWRFTLQPLAGIKFSPPPPNLHYSAAHRWATPDKNKYSLAGGTINICCCKHTAVKRALASSQKFHKGLSGELGIRMCYFSCLFNRIGGALMQLTKQKTVLCSACFKGAGNCAEATRSSRRLLAVFYFYTRFVV